MSMDWLTQSPQNKKEVILLERDFRAAVKANPEITDSEILRIFRSNLPKYRKAGRKGDHWSIFNPYYSTKKVRVKPFIDEGTEESKVLLNAFRNGRNQKQKLELLEAGIMASWRASASAETASSEESSNQKPKTIKIKNPKTLECWFCKKDDIKFGATVCNGCQAQIVYKTSGSQQAEENVLWVLYSIGVLVLIMLVVRLVSDVISESALAWCFGISVVVGGVLAHNHLKKKGEDNIVSTSVEFKKPKAKAAIFVGYTEE